MCWPFVRNGAPPLLLLLFDTMTITVQLPSAFIVEFYAQVISASEKQPSSTISQPTKQPTNHRGIVQAFFSVFVECFVWVFCLFNKTIHAKPRVDDRQTHIALPLQYCVNNSPHKSIFIVWPDDGSHIRNCPFVSEVSTAYSTSGKRPPKTDNLQITYKQLKVKWNVD